MARLRVSILGLIAIVVVSATAFAALRTASDLWFSAVYTLTVVLLLAAVLAARFQRGAAGAFWFGFAVFGWGFFVLGSFGWLNPDWESAPAASATINRHLLTARLILFLVPHLRAETNDLDSIDRITGNTIGIAHLLTTLLLAVCGGGLAAWFRSRRRRRSTSGRSGNAASLAVIVVAASMGLVVSLESAASPPADFFAVDEPDGDTGLRRSEATWYSKHLAAMAEPSLWRRDSPDPAAVVFRWLWLPSVQHPICVRLEHKGGKAQFRLVVLDGQGGYQPGGIAIDRTIALRPDAWEKLRARVEGSQFWEMPTHVPPSGITDATRLVWEGSRRGRYHVVVRRTPIPGDDVTLFRSLLELAGLKIDSIVD